MPEYLRVPPREVRGDLVRTGLMSRLLRGRRRDGSAARFFADAHDHIGVRIAARGFYDSYRLRALRTMLERNAALFRPAGRRAVCLDVGTNIGNHAVFLAPLFDRLLGFEPVPALALAARANALLNDLGNVEIRALALSDAAGTAPIALRPGNSGGSSLHPTRAHDGAPRIEVPLRRGDDVLAEALLPDDAVTLVKIDVEGHEDAALRGLDATLRDHRPAVWFEAHGGEAAAATLRTLGRDRYRHLYLFGDPIELRGETLLAGLSRGLRGMRFGLTELDGIPDNPYLNLLASPRPLH